MTKRETIDQLVETINTKLGLPAKAWSKPDHIYGQMRANVGSFVVDGAYGGYRLERMCNEGGGVDTPFGHNRYKLGEFQEFLRTVSTAISLTKEKP